MDIDSIFGSELRILTWSKRACGSVLDIILGIGSETDDIIINRSIDN